MPDSPLSPTAEISRIIEDATKNGKCLQDETITRIAGELSKQFSVTSDEIAILQLAPPDYGVLKFLYPQKLQNVGAIPLSASHSLAVRTVREKRPEIVNNFPAQKHPTVFEAVSLEQAGKDVQPIQKIMSAPLLLESKPVGVIQICRKGKSVTSAGGDFTIRDLTVLMTTASLVAKCFKAQ